MLLEEIDSSYDLQTQEVATLQSLIIIDQSLTFQPKQSSIWLKVESFRDVAQLKLFFKATDQSSY